MNVVLCGSMKIKDKIKKVKEELEKKIIKYFYQKNTYKNYQRQLPQKHI